MPLTLRAPEVCGIVRSPVLLRALHSTVAPFWPSLSNSRLGVASAPCNSCVVPLWCLVVVMLLLLLRLGGLGHSCVCGLWPAGVCLVCVNARIWSMHPLRHIYNTTCCAVTPQWQTGEDKRAFGPVGLVDLLGLLCWTPTDLTPRCGPCAYGPGLPPYIRLG